MDQASMKILLIEDNPADVGLLREALRTVPQVHYELTAVERLEAACAYLASSPESEARPPDVILLDLSLPDGHGLDNVRRLRATAPQMPIVVLTGLDDENMAAQALDGGAQDYLVKGRIDGNLLVRAMRYAIQRAQVQEALAASERKLRLLAANIHDTVLAYDLNGQLQYANPAFERLTEYPVAELATQDWLTYVYVEDRPILRHLWAELRQGHRFTDIEHRIVTRSSEIKWCATSGTPAYDEAGTQIGIQCRMADITARRRAEAALIESEERFRTVVAFTQEGILLVDREGQIELCNQSAEKLLGLKADQLRGRNLTQPEWHLLAEDGSPLPREQYPLLEALRTGAPRHNLIVGFQRPDGQVAWLRLNATPLFRPREREPYAALATFTARDESSHA